MDRYNAIYYIPANESIVKLFYTDCIPVKDIPDFSKVIEFTNMISVSSILHGQVHLTFHINESSTRYCSNGTLLQIVDQLMDDITC